MGTPNLFTTRVEAIEVHERAIVARYGNPARPVIIPLANVDAAPVDSLSGRRVYDLTMDRETAVECGLDI
jgi:hypothetical protein